MSNANDPAFPVDYAYEHPGLTKREWLAGLAMQGLLCNSVTNPVLEVASHAIRHADELIAELAKEAGK